MDPYSELRDVLSRRAQYLVEFSGKAPPVDQEELEELLTTLQNNLEHWLKTAYQAGYLDQAKMRDDYEEEHDPHHNHMSEKRFYDWKNTLFDL